LSLAISRQGHRVTEKTNGFLKSFFDHVYPVPLGEWILSLNLEASDMPCDAAVEPIFIPALKTKFVFNGSCSLNYPQS